MSVVRGAVLRVTATDIEYENLFSQWN